MKLSVNAVGILTLLALSSAGAAQTIDKKGLALDGAKKVIAAAVAKAKSKNAPGWRHCRGGRRRQSRCPRTAG